MPSNRHKNVKSSISWTAMSQESLIVGPQESKKQKRRRSGAFSVWSTVWQGRSSRERTGTAPGLRLAEAPWAEESLPLCISRAESEVRKSFSNNVWATLHSTLGSHSLLPEVYFYETKIVLLSFFLVDSLKDFKLIMQPWKGLIIPNQITHFLNILTDALKDKKTPGPRNKIHVFRCDCD